MKKLVGIVIILTVAMVFGTAPAFGLGEGMACCAKHESGEASMACCANMGNKNEAASGCCGGGGGHGEHGAGEAAGDHAGHGKGESAGGHSKGGDGACCGGGGHGSHGDAASAEGGPGMGGKGVMRGAHALIAQHESLDRIIEEIPNGVRTVTTLKEANPELLAVLQSHPREMYAHLDKGGHVRRWDPLFQELAKHADLVDVKFKDLENGIEVELTSENEQAVKLVRAHARKVVEFVERGRAAMHESTPLPEGYVSPE